MALLFLWELQLFLSMEDEVGPDQWFLEVPPRPPENHWKDFFKLEIPRPYTSKPNHGTLNTTRQEAGKEEGKHGYCGWCTVRVTWRHVVRVGGHLPSWCWWEGISEACHLLSLAHLFYCLLWT